MLKITGTCKISKDPTNSNLKMEFARTPNGAEIVKGSLYWYNSSKKEDKSSSNIRFVGYKNMVNFFRDHCHETIEITNAILKSYSGDRKDGTKYYGHEIVIFEAQVYQKQQPVAHFQEKEPESKLNEDLGEDIPW